jgi:tRNA-specific 2-thiouridylase
MFKKKQIRKTKKRKTKKREKGKREKERVVAAMSGGVDSSVAAALLKESGYDLVGVFMKFWQPSFKKDKKRTWSCFENRCCSSESEKRARAVADRLRIPFYVFNFEREFKKKVVDYFLKEEKAGLTPNPCVVCNKEIKFGLLLEKAFKLKADFVATGHYARKRELKTPLAVPLSAEQRARQNSKLKTFKLLRAKDKNKDQSYFLWRLNQKQLSRLLFPVGDYAKTEIRKLAKRFKLPVLEIPESQEICFVEKSVGEFLKRHLKEKPGKIVDSLGRPLGRHQGLWFYTIGQRKGINLPGGPYWVLEKDTRNNLLIVTRNENDLFKKEAVVKKVNWLSGKNPKLPLKVKAQIRYRQRPVLALVKPGKKGKVNVVFSARQRAITPGQSVAFYQKEELIGGGIIC